MRLKLFVALVIILFMIPAFSGCTWFSGDEDETGTSFKPAELAAPEIFLPRTNHNYPRDFPTISAGQWAPFTPTGEVSLG
jgi:hypothetical protein